MTTSPILRRAIPALTVAISTLVAAGSGALMLHATPAGAREVEPIEVRVGEEAYREYPAIPDSTNNASLAFVPDPEDCRTFSFCDTVPVKVPIPDIPKGDDYKLRIQLVWDSQESTQPMEIHLYDNRQLKERFGQPQPGDSGYDPRDKGYTRLASDTDPEGKWLEIGQPDLVDYNLVVVNTAGQNFGYAIRGNIELDAFVPPEEKTPPPPRVTSSGGGTTATAQPRPTSATTAVPTPGTSESELTLSELAARSDPDLQAIREQNLEDQLSAPEQLVTRTRAAAGPPEPPSSLALLFWLVVVPGLVAGAGSAFVMRRRRAVLAFS